MIGPKRLAVGALVAAVVVAGGYAYVVRRDEARVRGLAPAGERPFGDGDTLDGARRAVYSPDGNRLAVLTPQGLGLAENGAVRPVTARGSRVVDVAWFRNGATLLVAEGPVPTGGVAVVDIDGTVRGTIPLEPDIGFGEGHGMSVAPGGRSAVVTAVERPALGPEQRWLALIDLETGATRALTEPGGPDERRPFHLDATRVAFTEEAPDGTGRRAMVVTFADGSTEEVAVGAAVVGIVDDEIVLEDDRGRLTLAGRRIGTVPPRTSLSTLHPDGIDAVLATTVDTPEGGRTGRLQRIRLDAAPDR